MSYYHNVICGSRFRAFRKKLPIKIRGHRFGGNHEFSFLNREPPNKATIFINKQDFLNLRALIVTEKLYGTRPDRHFLFPDQLLIIFKYDLRLNL